MKKIIFILIFIVLASGTYLLSRSDKIHVTQSEESSTGVMYWTKNAMPLSAADLQDDAIVNVIYTNNEGYGVIRRLNNDKNPLIEIRFYAADNVAVAKVQEQWQYDVAFPEYLIAEDGSRIVSTDVSNRIRLFDSGANLQNSYKIIDEYRYSNETIIVNAASKNLDLLFTGMTVPGQGGTTLVLRTLENKILWQKKYPDWSVRAAAMSDDNTFIAAALYQSGETFKFKNLIMNQAGNILYESEQRTSAFRFEKNNLYAALLDKETIELVDLKKFEETGSYALETAGSIIVDAAFSDDGILLIQSAEVTRNNKDQFNPWQYINNKLTSLDMNAKKIAQVEFENDWVIQPSLRYDSSRKQFFYGHNAGFRFLNAAQ